MRASWLVFGVCLALTGQAQAQKSLIILDASGSMWGKIDGKPKLQIARDALRSVLSGIPPENEIGLMAYGHREKGNCSDIEMVVPPGRAKAGAITDAAGKLRFLGKTPLTHAVEQAAIALRYTEEKATVILITDGIETCKADPCALGAELAKSGVGFTAHVVGFGLSREEGRQVACLAEQTGGRYIPASNAAELQDALKSTVSRPSRQEPTQAVKPPPATVGTKSRPVIAQGFPVDWTGPAAPNDYIDIVPIGWKAFDSELSYVYVEKGKPASIRAPGKPGEYELRYVWAGPDGRRVLTTARISVADTPYAIEAPARVPAGTSFTVTWKGPGQPRDYIDIVPEAHRAADGELSFGYIESGNPLRMKAPGDTGRYALRYISEAPDGRRVLVRVPLEVTASEARLAFSPQATAGASIVVNWKGPGAEGDYIDIVPEGQKEPAGELAYAYVEQSEDGETVTLRAPGDAGNYRLRYILEAAGGRRVIADEPLFVAAANATLAAPGQVTRGTAIPVNWTGPNGAGDYIDLVPAGSTDVTGELTYFYTAGSNAPASLTAPDKAGRFELRYVMEAPDGRRILSRQVIEVR